MFSNEKQLVDAIFLHASVGILITNDRGEIVLANPFTQALFGYDDGELNGRKIEILIPSRYHHKHVHHREAFSNHMQNRPMGLGMDLYGVRKDGSEFPVEVSLCHYRNDDNNLVIAFINNITIRKKAEEEIRRLNDELEDKVEQRTFELKETMTKLEESTEELAKSLNKEKELNELKSRFVSLASHEFRTPLSTILSSTILLQKYTTTEEQSKRQKHTERIVSSVNGLTEILNDFLSVGKIEEGKIAVKPTTFTITRLINGIIEELKTIQKPGQQITYAHEGAETLVMDPTLLKHIVVNLLSNAIKFSPENATIAINSTLTDKQFILSVQDQGIGISKEDQAHLFERFFRASNASNIDGTGLGLHIVAKYAELMNGVISCNSIVDHGTTFTLVFTF
ncbi:two-component sensor histidine kinase [Filimonas lacunae]|nr:two-component sensor histidine kinase [Filimonas lacunae]